jgi:hypothetical protein
MSLIARGSASGGTFKPVPNGMHLARCYRIIDLGTQRSEYQGKPRVQRMVMISFEVHGEDDGGFPILTEKGEPMSISTTLTLSLGEKAKLRGLLVNWRGRDFTPDELNGFELKNILGAWAMISVAKEMSSNGKEYTNIKTVNPVPVAVKKSGLPEGHNKLEIFSTEEPDMDMYEKFSDYVKRKIEASPEWSERNRAPSKKSNDSGFDDMDSDIPF